MAGTAERVVVIGGGQAAAQVIEALRGHGYAGQLALVSDEPVLPYCRPPLSKAYLVGRQAPDWLLYRPAALYDRLGIAVHLGRRAVAIDRLSARVTLDDGQRLAYDRLVLAIGTRVRRLAVPGAEAAGVAYIRTLADVEHIRQRLPSARRVVIIGGGFIGLESAAVLAQSGRQVTVLAAQERLLPRAVPDAVSRFFLDQHLLHGVRVVTGAPVTAVEGGPVTTVRCADGTAHAADLVLAGIGIVPNQELAAAAGLACDDGILVDELGQTSDPAILAAGDCTRHPNPWAKRAIRLETVHNAVEQAKTVAATIAGHHRPYRQAPWVWSDQYRLRLQTVGVQEGADQLVMRGDPASGRFGVFYFRAGAFQAMTAVNRPREFGACRRLLNEGRALTPDQAADPALDLDALAPRRPRLDFDTPWPSRARHPIPPPDQGALS